MAHWGLFTYNKELRDLVAVGAACGVTTAFKAPVSDGDSGHGRVGGRINLSPPTHTPLLSHPWLSPLYSHLLSTLACSMADAG